MEPIMNHLNISPSCRILAAIAAGAATTLAATATHADPVSRPTNVSDTRNSTTTAKVLVAVPADRPLPSNFLYVQQYPPNAIRRGRPLLMDDYVRDDVDYTVGYVRPLTRIFRYTYDGFSPDVIFGTTPARSGFQTVRGSDASSSSASDMMNDTTVTGEPVDASDVGTVFAAGFKPVDTLSPAMQNDGFALLNAGRNRDAKAVFERAEGADAKAGLAISTTLLGDIEGGRDLFVAMANDTPADLPIDDAVKARLSMLGETLFAESPVAKKVVADLAG
jgi:hypothetical protein